MAGKIAALGGSLGSAGAGKGRVIGESPKKTEKDLSKTAAKSYRSGGGGGEEAVEQTQTMTPAVSEDPIWGSMKSYYESAYAQAIRESEDTRDRAVDRAQKDARRRSEAIAGEYEGLDRQLYRDYMEQRRTLPQELAALGYTGGMSESARVRLFNGYQEALAENGRERARRLDEVDYELSLAREQAQAEADKSAAAARRSREQSLMNLEKQRYDQERSDALTRARALANAGDFSGYRALGWSEGEIAYLSAMWQAKNPKAAGAASYGHYAG